MRRALWFLAAALICVVASSLRWWLGYPELMWTDRAILFLASVATWVCTGKALL